MTGKGLDHASTTTSCSGRLAGNETASTRSSLPIRLLAAEAGFFPRGPLTFFADIMMNELGETGKVKDSRKEAWSNKMTEELDLQRDLD